MRILGIDTETTGLDDETDRIIEVGCCLWDWDSKLPLALYSSLVIPERDIPEEITTLTGITAGQVNEFGWPEEVVLGQVDELLIKADYIMAHNSPFDKGFFDKGIERQKMAPRNIPWLDSMRDIVFPKEVATRNLNYLAAESGFINPWRHRAIFDVMTMLKLASDYDIEAIIARSKEPILYVQAIVSFEEKELAKDRGYRWHGQSKRWWREWKSSDYEADKLECPFRTQLLPGALE